MAKKTTKKTTKKASTALAVRKPAKPAPVAEPVALDRPAPPLDSSPGLTLKEGEMALGALGLEEVKLSEAEEKVLSEAVPLDRVRVKPNGAVYLPHSDYTAWMNRAFGRLGWAIVPVGTAREVVEGKKRQVVVPYVLHIHGKKVAFAMGEQDYWAGNADQSYGDAAEGTVASALRRCLKRIGVGAELWDRQWGHQFLEANAVAVKVAKRDVQGNQSVKTQWRLKADPPLPNEMKQGERVPAQREPAASKHAHENEPITVEQRTRLFTIAKNAGHTKEGVADILEQMIGSRSSSDIKRKDYDSVIRRIEHPTVTSSPVITDDTIDWGDYRVEDDREPGSEG